MKQEWLEHPLTKDLVTQINKQVENIKEDWSNGAFSVDPKHEHAALGAIKAYRDIVNAITEVAIDA